jgi:hypothetical protein
MQRITKIHYQVKMSRYDDDIDGRFVGSGSGSGNRFIKGKPQGLVTVIGVSNQ